MNSLNKQSLIYTLSAVFFWSTVATAFKITLEGMSFAQLLFYSSFASSLVLGLLIIKGGEKISFSLNSLLLGILNPFLYYLLLFKAYSLLPAQEAQPLNYTWPIVFSLLLVAVMKEKFTYKKAVGLGSAFVGVIIITTHGDFIELKFNNFVGVAFALSTSVVWAVFWIFNLKDKRDSTVKLFTSFFIGTILSAIYIWLFESFKIPNGKYLFGAVYIGVFEMSVTFLLWSKGLELSKDKVKTTTLAYLSPFISLIFIAFVLGEKIMVSSFIGLIFIIGGIVYQNISTNN